MYETLRIVTETVCNCKANSVTFLLTEFNCPGLWPIALCRMQQDQLEIHGNVVTFLKRENTSWSNRLSRDWTRNPCTWIQCKYRGSVASVPFVESRETVEGLSIGRTTGHRRGRSFDVAAMRRQRESFGRKQARSDVGSGARLRNKWREWQRKTSISRRDERARTKPVTGGTCGPTVCRGDVATIWGQVSDIQAEFKRLFAWLQTLDGQWRLSNCSQARCNKTNLSTWFHWSPLLALFTALPSTNTNTIDSLFYLLLPHTNARCSTCFVHVSYSLFKFAVIFLQKEGNLRNSLEDYYANVSPSPRDSFAKQSLVLAACDSSSREPKHGSSPLLAGSYYAWGEFQRPWS